jgi:hypothetical protein
MPILSHGIFNEHGCATVLLELICNATYLEYESTPHGKKNACRGHVIASEICGDEGSSFPRRLARRGWAEMPWQRVLCVAEKPSISKSITQILSGGQFETVSG